MFDITQPLRGVYELFFYIYDYARFFFRIMGMPLDDAIYAIGREFGIGLDFLVDLINPFLNLIGIGDTPIWTWLFTSFLGLLIVITLIYWVFKTIDAINPL